MVELIRFQVHQESKVKDDLMDNKFGCQQSTPSGTQKSGAPHLNKRHGLANARLYHLWSKPPQSNYLWLFTDWLNHPKTRRSLSNSETCKSFTMFWQRPFIMTWWMTTLTHCYWILYPPRQTDLFGHPIQTVFGFLNHLTLYLVRR